MYLLNNDTFVVFSRIYGTLTRFSNFIYHL